LLYLRNTKGKKRLESADVDTVTFLDGLGADELLEHAGASLP
jgi:hypothetical protein